MSSINQSTPKTMKFLFDKIKSNDISIGEDLNFVTARFNNDDFLKYFLKSLQSNTTLKSINISDNEINDKSISFFASILKSNNSLETVDISDNCFSSIGMKNLFEALKINTSIKSLNVLKNFAFDESVAKTLLEALKINTTLKKLNLEHCDIVPEEMFFIAEMLKINKSLIEFNIGCQFGSQSIEYISDALKINNTLKNLQMAFMNIGSDAKLLGEALKANNTLTHLSISYCRLHREGIYFIAQALKINTTLQKIGLSFNKIGRKGADNIADVLNINTTLTCIDLSHNDIVKYDFFKITKALKTNTTLKQINFSGNDLREDGLKLISKALMINNTLKYIGLIHGLFVGLDNESAVLFAKMLQINTTLTTIDFRFNGLKNDAIICVTKGCSLNTTLKRINFDWNKNDDDYVNNTQELVTLLQNNKNLKVLNIAGSKFGDNFLSVAKALEMNDTLIEIDISNCGIVGKLFNSFIEMLKVNKSLEIVKFSKNESIKSANFKLLIEALKVNQTLKELHGGEFEISMYNKSVAPFIKALKQHKSLQKLTFLDIVCDRIARKLIKLMEEKPTLSIDFILYGSPVSKFTFYTHRNEFNCNKFNWQNVCTQIIDVCLGLHAFRLPAYVLLEIIDWFPWFEYVNQRKKIHLIIDVKQSIEKVLNLRERNKQ